MRCLIPPLQIPPPPQLTPLALRMNFHLPEHGHGEPLGEHVHNEGPQCIQAGQLVGQVHPASLLPELEEQDPCMYGRGVDDRDPARVEGVMEVDDGDEKGE